MENSRISWQLPLLQPSVNVAASETDAGSVPMSMGATQIESQAVSFGADADQFFRLGLIYSTGGSVPADMVTAHKWFNIAAMRGSREAVNHRCELAREMSSADIAAAQRAARAWLTRH
jgi:hypothetical protein